MLNSLNQALLMLKQLLNHMKFRCLLLHTLPTSSNVEAMSGVQMGPGATALTLIPLLTNWLDSERVNAICRWGRSEECKSVVLRACALSLLEHYCLSNTHESGTHARNKTAGCICITGCA